MKAHLKAFFALRIFLSISASYLFQQQNSSFHIMYNYACQFLFPLCISLHLSPPYSLSMFDIYIFIIYVHLLYFHPLCVFTQDTVVALQALSKFAKLALGNANMSVTATASSQSHTYSIDSTNALVLQSRVVSGTSAVRELSSLSGVCVTNGCGVK